MMPNPEVFATEKRNRRTNMNLLCLNVFLPWMLFCTLYSVMTFKTHYDSPEFAWLLVLAGYSVALVSGVLGWRAQRRGLDHSWYAFSTLACFVAVSLAIAAGNVNYSYFMKPLYSIETLNTYPAVDPAGAKGGQLMDAGRAYFTEDTGIDMKRAMGFMNSETFCVAPIVSGNGKMASYDFWAVGKNCCSGVSSDFRCGDYNNPHAHAGLRMARDDERAFYRLAVQQAEAAYGIKSTHPLFFYWTQDPNMELMDWKDKGHYYFLVGVFSYFAFNVLCVVVASDAMSKGHF